MKLIIKLIKMFKGIYSAFFINMLLLFNKLNGKKNLIFRFDAYMQIIHLESIIKEMYKDSNIKIIILITPVDIPQTKKLFPDIYVGSSYATEGILFYDVFLGVSTVMRTPKWGKKKRICTFYGQSSKGFLYKEMNKKGYDILFFYGNYMLDFYKSQKKIVSGLKDYQYYITGQPKTDDFFIKADVVKQKELVSELGMDTTKKTILYAPSYEYCSSLETNGDEILETLIQTGLNIIIKPHPGIFSLHFDYSKNWLQKLKDLSVKEENFLFYQDKNIDKALFACDIFLTDYSGVAFDAISIGKKMIYWYSPSYYNKYLPETYGIETDIAEKELWGNVGRGKAGIEVKNIKALSKAIQFYLENSDPYIEEKKKLSNYIFANKGQATKIMTETIYKVVNDE